MAPKFKLAAGWEQVAREEKALVREFLGGETAKIISPPIVEEARRRLLERYPFFRSIPWTWWETGRTDTGEKLGKYLRKQIAPEFEQDFLRLWNEVAPLFKTQEVIITIEPDEYPKISDNTTGWRSCHSPGGSYFFGNFTYLFDEHTIIAYSLDSNGLKKWRMLIYIKHDPPALILSKEYPQHIYTLYRTTRDFLLRKYQEYFEAEPYEQNRERIEVRTGNDVFTPYVDWNCFEVYSHVSLAFGTVLNFQRGQELASDHVLFGCSYCGKFSPIYEYDWKNECCGGKERCEFCGNFCPPCQIEEIDGYFLCPNCYEEYQERLEEEEEKEE